LGNSRASSLWSRGRPMRIVCTARAG
jgi:hypothetical protein